MRQEDMEVKMDMKLMDKLTVSIKINLLEASQVKKRKITLLEFLNTKAKSTDSRKT